MLVLYSSTPPLPHLINCGTPHSAAVMELLKRDWFDCRSEGGKKGNFRVMQWNTLADGME